MSEIKVNKVSPATGTAIQLGDSGDTFTVPSGATIVNSGTATGFGGGIWEFVSSVTAASSSTLEFTNMASGYDYTYVLEHIVSTNDSAFIRLRLGVAGPTYRTTGYFSAGTAITNPGGSQSSEATDSILMMSDGNEAIGTGTDESLKVAELTVYDPAGTTNDTMVMGDLYVHGASPQTQRHWFVGFYNTATEVHTSIQFYLSAGDMTSGKIYQYRRLRS